MPTHGAVDDSSHQGRKRRRTRGARCALAAVRALIALSLALPASAAAQISDAEFVVVAPGSFRMGSSSGDDGRRPVRVVTLTRPFRLQKTRVTHAQWQAVMDTNPSKRRNCPSCPVDNVSYLDVQRFIERLNAVAAAKYRLPTEAEWEYAARAGSSGALGEPGAMTQGGFIADYAAGITQPVGSAPPNAWGLHDMEGNSSPGNVWEWVHDWYGPFSPSAATDPAGPATGELRVLRGGAFQTTAAFPGAVCRLAIGPTRTCVARVSFRLVLEKR